MTNPIRVQKIGHVGLYCRDLPRMVEFYTRVLGFQVADVNEKGMTFLRFGADHHSFVLAKAPEAPTGPTVLQQIAMEVADLDDPEGNRLQFFCEMDQIGWDGKSRPKEQWKRFTLED